MLMTLDEISTKYYISKRKIESNLALLKPIYQNTNKMVFNGQKWLIDTTLIKEITNRNYARHLVEWDDSKKVDDIDIKSIIKEKDLRTFITIAPRGITSMIKIKDIARDVFDYYQQNYSPDEPTFFIYSLETNSLYFKDKPESTEADYQICYHIHAVTNAGYSPEQHKELTEILQDQVDDYKVHHTHTVAISPYVMDIGIGALNYTLKMREFTGAFIK
jgi:hypothetical protein